MRSARARSGLCRLVAQATLRALPLDAATAGAHVERLAAACRGRFALPDAQGQGLQVRVGDARAGAAGAAAALQGGPASNGAARGGRAGLGSDARLDAGAAVGHILAAPAVTRGDAHGEGGPDTSGRESSWAGDRGSVGSAAPHTGSPMRARAHREHLRPAAEAYGGFAADSGPQAGGAAGRPAPAPGEGCDAGPGLPGLRPAGTGAAPAQPAGALATGDDPLGAGAMFGSPAQPVGRAEATVGPSRVLPPSAAVDPLPAEEPGLPSGMQPAASAAAGSEAWTGGGAAEPAPCGSALAAERPAELRRLQACSRADSSAQAPTSSTAGEAGLRDGHAAGGGGNSGGGNSGVAAAGGPSGPGEPSCSSRDDEHGGSGGGGGDEYEVLDPQTLQRVGSDASELDYAAADPAQPRRGLRRFRPSVAASGPGHGPSTDPDAGGGADRFGPAPGSFRIRSADGEGPLGLGPGVQAAPADAPAALAAGRRRLFSEPSAAASAVRSWDAAGGAAAERASELGGAEAGGGLLEGLPGSLPADVPPRGPVGRRLTDIFAGLEAGRGAGSDPALFSAGASADWSGSGGGRMSGHVPKGPDQVSPADGAAALASSTGVKMEDGSMVRAPDQAPSGVHEAFGVGEDHSALAAPGQAAEQGPGLQRPALAGSGPERVGVSIAGEQGVELHTEPRMTDVEAASAASSATARGGALRESWDLGS